MAESWDKNYSLFTAALLLIVLYMNYWLIANKIEVGTIYFYMLLAASITFVIALIFVKGDDLAPINRFLRSPFSISLGVAALTYLIGWIVPILFKFFIPFNITSFSIPLSAGGKLGNQFFQSFSAAELSQDMSWQLFNISFNAGITEEYVFTFGTMIAGVIIGMVLAQLLFTRKNKEVPLGYKNFVLIFAILFSTGLFMYVHKLNSTYVGIMFLIAGLFKLISIVTIYVSGFFLTFWIGYHQANNMLFLIQYHGVDAVIQGFVSWFGLFFVAWFGLIILYLYRNIDTIWSDLKESF